MTNNRIAMMNGHRGRRKACPYKDAVIYMIIWSKTSMSQPILNHPQNRVDIAPAMLTGEQCILINPPRRS